MKEKTLKEYLVFHLKENNISYFRHLVFAITLSRIFLEASILLSLHAIFPFILIDCASKRIKKINKMLELDSVQE